MGNLFLVCTCHVYLVGLRAVPWESSQTRKVFHLPLSRIWTVLLKRNILLCFLTGIRLFTSLDYQVTLWIFIPSSTSLFVLQPRWICSVTLSNTLRTVGETARQRINMYGNILRPLFPFIADPLLTTVSFNFGISEKFLGRSLPHPNGSGRLVCRTRPFNTSALTNNVRVNKSTLIGRCAYFTGLFVLPCHNITLCYFVPDGLKVLTQEMIAAWKCGRISVCAVHFLHCSRKFSNCLLNNIVSGI